MTRSKRPCLECGRLMKAYEAIFFGRCAVCRETTRAPAIEPSRCACCERPLGGAYAELPSELLPTAVCHDCILESCWMLPDDARRAIHQVRAVGKGIHVLSGVA